VWSDTTTVSVLHAVERPLVLHLCIILYHNLIHKELCKNVTISVSL